MIQRDGYLKVYKSARQKEPIYLGPNNLITMKIENFLMYSIRRNLDQYYLFVENPEDDAYLIAPDSPVIYSYNECTGVLTHGHRRKRQESKMRSTCRKFHQGHEGKTPLPKKVGQIVLEILTHYNQYQPRAK